jgi:glycosyltransferase involved in cell wall biosynthesis
MSHMTPLGDKISVCLLTYNHVNLIESTIRSVLEQTVQGFEFVVSDDRSTDGTWEKILDLAKTDRRIKPIQTPHNMGMPGNANFAVAQSDRPYIALLHHDDLCRNDLLEKWVSVMNKYPESSFVFNSYDDGNSEHTYGPKLNVENIDGQYLLEKYLFKSWGCPVRGTAMIRRAAWDKIGGMRVEFNLLADIDVWMRLSAIGSVGYVADAIISVRHQRPVDYPEEYREGSWSWRRQRFLYEIHAANRQTYYRLNTIVGRIKWWGFRVKLTIETTKWLIYAVVRKKPAMITTSNDSVTAYDLWPVRLLRWFLQKIYPVSVSPATREP